MKSLLLAAAALLIPAGAAFTQPPPPGGPDQAEMARHHQDEVRDLSIVLSLKPAQQPALEAWMAAMHPRDDMQGRRHGDRPGDAGRPRTTPEMLQSRQAHIAERQQAETGRIAATKRFYAQLDGRQQQVFDALGRLRHEGHGPHGPHHGGGGHDGPPHGGPDAPPPPPPPGAGAR